MQGQAQHAVVTAIVTFSNENWAQPATCAWQAVELGFDARCDAPEPSDISLVPAVNQMSRRSESSSPPSGWGTYDRHITIMVLESSRLCLR